MLLYLDFPLINDQVTIKINQIKYTRRYVIYCDIAFVKNNYYKNLKIQKIEEYIHKLKDEKGLSVINLSHSSGLNHKLPREGKHTGTAQISIQYSHF